MSIECQETAIMIYLRSKGGVYHAKILELREVIEGWLAYHTRFHTIQGIQFDIAMKLFARCPNCCSRMKIRDNQFFLLRQLKPMCSLLRHTYTMQEWWRRTKRSSSY